MVVYQASSLNLKHQLKIRCLKPEDYPLLFFLDEEECGLSYDGQNIVFTKRVSYVRTSESYIWVINRDGQIFKVEQDGSKTCLDTCDVQSIVGCGTFDDNLWIAFSDGTVTILGSRGELKKPGFFL